MLPEYLGQICEELETQQGLINLNFRKNVIRNAETSESFVAAMTSLVKAAPALMHLDISGMFLGDEGIKTIVCEGVA